MGNTCLDNQKQKKVSDAKAGRRDNIKYSNNNMNKFPNGLDAGTRNVQDFNTPKDQNMNSYPKSNQLEQYDPNDFVFNELKKYELELIKKYYIYPENTFDINSFKILNNTFISSQIIPYIQIPALNASSRLKICKKQIEKEIDIIKNDPSRLEIKYVTILVLGKNGIGKSTLINSLRRRKINFVKFIKKDGLNDIQSNYNEIEKIINDRRQLPDTNDYIQCIWFCITGDQLESYEIDLLKKFKEKKNTIPLILVYTQYKDTKKFNKMKYEIKNFDKENFFNIDDITKILAEEFEDENGVHSPAIGHENLIRNTITRCKAYIVSDIMKINTKNIPQDIIKNLEKEAKDKEEEISTKNYQKIKTFQGDDEFNNILKQMYATYERYFVQLGISINNKEIIFNKIPKYTENYKQFLNQKIIKYYDENNENKIKNDISISLLKEQARLEVEKRKNINIENKRDFDSFMSSISISKEFLIEKIMPKYYRDAQIQLFSDISKHLQQNLSNFYKTNFNSNDMQALLNDKSLERTFNDCFYVKYGDFSERIKNSLDNKSIVKYA